MKTFLFLLGLSTAGCLTNYGHPLVNQRVEGAHSWTRAKAQEAIDKLPLDERKAVAWRIAFALGDSDPCIRLNAASGLGELGPLAMPFVPVLEKAIGDTDPRVRKEAGITLAKLGHPSGAFVIAELFEAVKGDSKFRRYLHFITYWDLAYDEERDENWWQRYQGVNDLWLIAEGPQHIQLAGLVSALTAALADPAPKVRRHAAGALGALGAVDAAPAMPALIKLVEDHDDNVRAEAAHTLRSFGTPQALDAIRAFDMFKRSPPNAADRRGEARARDFLVKYGSELRVGAK